MKKTLLLLAIIIANTSHSQQTNFNWAKSFLQNTGSGSAADIAIDASGNVFTTGSHTGLNFDPLLSTGGYRASSGGDDGYIVKLDNSGNYIWAGTIGGTSGDYGTGIAVDNASNVLACGSFSGTADLDPSTGTFTVASGLVNSYIVKLNNGGTFQWAASIGGSGYNFAQKIACDASGNVYIAGRFTGTTDFDPGLSVFNVIANADDAFLLKLAPNGSFVWVRTFGGNNLDAAYDVAVDYNDDVYITGEYFGVVDFDPSVASFTLAPTGNSDYYVSKFSSSGNFIWASGFGSVGYDFGAAIHTDPAGNVYVAGQYGSPVSASTATLANSGNVEIFMIKYTASGNAIWAKNFTGTGTEYVKSIYVDGSGNLYLTGRFNSVTDFDPSSGTFNLTPTFSFGSTFDIFICKLDSSGIFKWALRMGDSGSDGGNGIVLDQSRNIYSTGDFLGTVDFDPGSATYSIVPPNGSNIYPYVHKLCQFPDQPSPISGPTLSCPFTEQTYTIVAVPTATAYNWLFPTLWGGSAFTTVATPTVNSAGTISVQAINSCGISTRSLNVQLLQVPNISVSSGSICPGSSFTMVPNGAVSYTFSSGSSVVTPSATAAYSISGTNSFGCVSTVPGTATVFVHSLPSISATSGTLCLGSQYTIGVSGALNYTFSSGTAYVSPFVTTTYSVIGTSVYGCLSATPAIATVSVLTLPLPSITVNSGTICVGKTFTIVPNGAVTYTINGGQFIVSPIVTSSYSLMGTDALGCISNQSALSNIVVNPLPTVNIAPTNLNYCNGDQIYLIASGADSYTWSTSASSPTIIVIAEPPIIYTVTGQDAFGCIKTASFVLTPNDCTGLAEQDEFENILIFPNPSNEIINIKKTLNNNYDLSILDTSGRILKKQALNYNENTLNVSDLAPGVYFIVLKSNEHNMRAKFIKQ